MNKNPTDPEKQNKDNSNLEIKSVNYSSPLKDYCMAEQLSKKMIESGEIPILNISCSCKKCSPYY